MFEDNPAALRLPHCDMSRLLSVPSYPTIGDDSRCDAIAARCCDATTRLPPINRFSCGGDFDTTDGHSRWCNTRAAAALVAIKARATAVCPKAVFESLLDANFHPRAAIPASGRA